MKPAMPHVIAWCGFLGAWLLVAGPLDQAVREIEETGFEHEALEEAKGRVEEPAPVSRWWLLLPPFLDCPINSDNVLLLRPLTVNLVV